MKRCGALLAVPAAAVVLASSVVLHGTVLVAIAVATGLAGCVAYALGDGGRPASVEAAWKAAAGVLVVSMGTATLFVVLGGAAAAVFVLVVAAGVGAALLRWCLRVRLLDRWENGTAPPEDQAAEGTPSAGPLHRFSVPVSLLPTPALGREWRRTRLALGSASGPAAWDEVVRRRRALLDEVERRDPDGFARWLADGAPAGGGPGTFLYG